MGVKEKLGESHKRKKECSKDILGCPEILPVGSSAPNTCPPCWSVCLFQSPQGLCVRTFLIAPISGGSQTVLPGRPSSWGWKGGRSRPLHCRAPGASAQAHQPGSCPLLLWLQGLENRLLLIERDSEGVAGSGACTPAEQRK